MRERRINQQSIHHSHLPGNTVHVLVFRERVGRLGNGLRRRRGKDAVRGAIVCCSTKRLHVRC